MGRTKEPSATPGLQQLPATIDGGRPTPAQQSRSDVMISIVVPSFNSGTYIGEAIRSALAQKGPSLEVLVQDACSTDHTLAVVRSFEDERVKLVSEPDSGQADALNRAIARAKGEWIVWLNADDMLAEGAFDRIARFIEGPYDVIYGHFEIIDAESRRVKRYWTSPELDQRRLLTSGCYVFSGTLLVRRAMYARFGGYDDGLACVMDYDFILRIAPHVRAVHADHTLAYFRDQPDSKTSRRKWEFFRESITVRRRHGGFRGTRAPGTLLRQCLDALYFLSRSFWTSPAVRRALPDKRL